MVGGALLGAAANRQVCPTISEMTFGNQSNPLFSRRGTAETKQRRVPLRLGCYSLKSSVGLSNNCSRYSSHSL
jgi:hypothetical protein